MPKNKWDDVPAFMAEVDKLYDLISKRRVQEGKTPVTKLGLTIEKIVEVRLWEPVLPLIKDNFERVLTELQAFYVPKSLQPGPAFVFPIRDTDGTYPMAQTKPLPGSIYEEKKYRRIGIDPIGPQWLGNTPNVLKAVIQHRAALLVEGPFDLLACRLLMPDGPILTPLTKYMGDDHAAYLRILGVRRLFLMYDNETTGSGQAAMDYQANTIKDMAVQKFYCPAHDPSDALKNLKKAQTLRDMLKRSLG